VYGMPDGIMRIPANGGNPELLLKSNVQCIAPQILPGGKSILFTVSPTPYKVVVQSLESGERKELFSGDTARYIPTGHIVYALENNLFAIAFDPDRLEVVGGPVSLVEGIFRTMAPQYAVSDSGTLVYVPATAAAAISPQRTLVWVDRKGKEEPIAAEPNNYNFPKISPDGTKVALSFPTGGNQNIWVWDLVRKTMTRLTFDEAGDFLPLWSPDGKRIAFMSSRGGKPSIYWKAADGTGADELLASASGRYIGPRSWSGDGKTLVFMEVGAGTGADIGVVSVEGDRTKKLLLHEKYAEMDPQISPDGRWMAYASDESGRFEIYVRPYPEVKGGKWQVSTSGGIWPLWSRDGRELFYRSGNAFMAVWVKTGPTFSLETPRMMFRGTYAFFPTIPNVSNWEISPDGKRFLMIKSSASSGSASEAPEPRKITIVLNWFEELKQRVRVK
jgi:WD40 repeat protein